MKTPFGWWNVPRRFLPAVGVHAGFPADAAVHLGEEGRRDLDHGDPPHVDRGRKPGQVADDAAAQGDQGGLPVRPEGGQLFGDGEDGLDLLGGLAGGHRDPLDAKVGLLQGLLHPIPMEGVDPGIGDDDVPLGPVVPRQDHRHAVQDLLADVDLVGIADLPVEVHLDLVHQSLPIPLRIVSDRRFTSSMSR